MSDYIAELKKRIRIEDVIEETVSLDRHSGRGYTRGSQRKVGEHGLVVNLDMQLYYWNGNAEYGSGDVITWVMIRDRVDFKRAVEVLAKKANMTPPTWSAEEGARFAAVRVREEIFAVAQRIFEKWLWQDERTLEYVHGRGWTDETIRLLTLEDGKVKAHGAGLGFSGWGKKENYDEMHEALAATTDLFSSQAVAILGLKGGVDEWCRKHEIEPKDSWKEWKAIPGMMGKPRLVYPHFLFGRVTYLTGRNLKEGEGGRLVGSDEPKSFNLVEQLAGKRQLYFNHRYAPKAEEVILVEGQADAVTLGQWGFDAVALAGTAWKDHEREIAELRERHPILYVALDADKAGSEAVRGKRNEWPLVEICGAMCRVATWPEKDANDWLQALQREGIEHAEQVKQARGVLDEARPFAVTVAEWAGGQKGAARDVALVKGLKVIATMSEMNQAQYKGDLARGLGLDMQEYNRMLKVALGEAKSKEGGEVPTEYTFAGGLIGNWLVEYCYDPESGKAAFAYRSPEGKIDMTDELVIDGIRYVPTLPSKMVTQRVVLFPSRLARELKTTKELALIVEAFLKGHYLFDDEKLARMISYYVLLTWLYDNFNTLCYLRAVGDAGAGKSELMRRIGHLCYRLTMANGAGTLSSFFRTVEMFKGTVFFDEMDLVQGGGAEDERIKFVNLGAMRGNPIIRMEKVITPDGSENYVPMPFETFGPKLFAMRKEFRDDAVASRSITIRLMAKDPEELMAHGVKLHIDDDFRNQTTAIRNLLLTWRMHEWIPERALGDELMDIFVSARLNQVTMPIKSLAGGDQEFLGQITQLLRDIYADQVLERSMTLAARVADALWKIYIYPDLRKKCMVVQPDGMIHIKVGDVTAITNNIMNEMNAEGDELLDMPKEDEKADGKGDGKGKTKLRGEVEPKTVGRIIRNNLQLRILPRTNKGFFCEWDDLKMMVMGRKYGSLPAESQIAKAQEEVAKIQARVTTRPPRQTELITNGDEGPEEPPVDLESEGDNPTPNPSPTCGEGGREGEEADQ